MKNWLIALLLLIPALALSKESSDLIQFSEPPFWLPSYNELHGFNDEQKAFYLSRIEPLAKQVPALRELSKGQLIEATDWEETWRRIQTQFYRACKWQTEYEKICDEAADLRVSTIMKRANKSLENRTAEETPRSSAPNKPMKEQEMRPEKKIRENPAATEPRRQSTYRPPAPTKASEGKH